MKNKFTLLLVSLLFVGSLFAQDRCVPGSVDKSNIPETYYGQKCFKDSIRLGYGERNSILILNSNGKITTAGAAASTRLTYAQLMVKINAGTLVPNAYYTITNFRSVMMVPGRHFTNISKRNSAIPIHDLIVQAKSTTKLYPEAYDTEFPDDLVYYDVTGAKGGVAYPGDTSCKGWIYYRETSGSAVVSGYTQNRCQWYGFDPRALVQSVYACDLASYGGSAISHCLLRKTAALGFDSTGAYITRTALDTNVYSGSNTDGCKYLFWIQNSRSLSNQRNVIFKLKYSYSVATHGPLPYFYTTGSMNGTTIDALFTHFVVAGPDSLSGGMDQSIFDSWDLKVLVYSPSSSYPDAPVLNAAVNGTKFWLTLIGGGMWFTRNPVYSPVNLTFIKGTFTGGAYFSNAKMWANLSAISTNIYQPMGRYENVNISISNNSMALGTVYRNIGKAETNINNTEEALTPVANTMGTICDGISANSIIKTYSFGGTTTATITLTGTDIYCGILNLTNGSAGVTITTLTGSVNTNQMIIRNNTGQTFNLGTGGNFKFPAYITAPLAITDGSEIKLTRSGSNWIVGN